MPNLAVVAVDTAGDARNGDIDLFNAAGRVNVVIDIEGWFQLTYPSGISGTVSDTQTPAQPIADATVTYTGIDGTLEAAARQLPRRRLPVVECAPGHLHGRRGPRRDSHRQQQQTLTVTPSAIATANLVLTATSSISGGVFDTQTPAQAVAGATVTYAAPPATRRPAPRQRIPTETTRSAESHPVRRRSPATIGRTPRRLRRR